MSTGLTFPWTWDHHIPLSAGQKYSLVADCAPPLNSQEFFDGWAVCRGFGSPWRQSHPNQSVPECVSKDGDLRKGPFPSYCPQLPDVPGSVCWGAFLQKPASGQQRSHAVDLQPDPQQQLRHHPETLLWPGCPWGPPGLPYQHLSQGHLVEAAHFLPAIQLLPPVSQGRRRG